MAKNFDDYLNDPRIKDEPMGLRITRAMRFKVQEETEGMTDSEQTAYYHEGASAAFYRLAHKYIDLSLQCGGSYGTRGAGETRLETDRRQIEKRIHKLEKEIEEVAKQRQV